MGTARDQEPWRESWKTGNGVNEAVNVGAAAAHDGMSPAAGVTEAGRFLSAHPGIRFVELLLPDTNGIFRGKWIPAASLPRVCESGVALAKSTFSLDVWGRDVPGTGLDITAGDPDGLCFPVPGTLTPVPWAKAPGAQVLMTMISRDRAPVFAEPRNCLRRAAGRLGDAGLNAVAAVELEFYLVEPESVTAGRPRAVLNGGDGAVTARRTYAVDDIRAFESVFADIRAACEIQGVPMDTVIAEASPGQFEVNLVHNADVLAAADQAVLLKRLIKGTAEAHGLIASFMAKPFEELPGSGMHVHLSLTGADGGNVFGNDPSGELKGHAVAGLLDSLPAAVALTAPSVNSYRRLEPGSFAPVEPTWGRENRSVAIRIPDAPPPASRLEHRVAGADANPYLVMAAVLAGVHRGLTGRMRPPPETVGGSERETAGSLPASQPSALDLFAQSPFIAEYFGRDYARLYETVRRAEMRTVGKVVTDLEYRTYLRDA